MTINHNKINMKVHVTKYALTKGIIEVDIIISEVHPGMVVDSENSLACYHKPHWFITREEAVDRAETMRTQKIASLEKTMKKLKGLDFRKTS